MVRYIRHEGGRAASYGASVALVEYKALGGRYSGLMSFTLEYR
jgi:hypothetical protein